MINTSHGYTRGKRYFCGYWRAAHTIIDIQENGDVVSKWADGHITVHATRFDARMGDKEL